MTNILYKTGLRLMRSKFCSKNGTIQRKNPFVILTLVALFATLVPRESSSATTTYTNLADLQAAAGSLVTIDFATGDDGQPLAPLGGEQSYSFSGLTVKGVEFSSPGYLIAANYGYQPPFLYGSNTLSPTSYLQASLPPGTTAIAATLGSFVTYSPLPRFEVTLSTGETFMTGLGFFGAVSTVPLEWVRFRFASEVQAGYLFDTVVLWDFHYMQDGPLYAEIQIQAVNSIVTTLPPTSVTTAGNQNALSNFLSQAIVAIQAGNFVKAQAKLQQAIERTDGCALSGSPDSNGPGRDWITNCAAQIPIYQLLTDALDAITP